MHSPRPTSHGQISDEGDPKNRQQYSIFLLCDLQML